MPRQTTVNSEHNTMYNFYVNKLEQLDFVKAVTESGNLRAQSATLRALMYLYVNDTETREKTNNIVNDFLVYKQNGKLSIK